LVKTDLQQRFSLRADTLITLRSIGIGESAIQQALENYSLPPAVQLGFRVTNDEIQTKLLFPAGFPLQQRQHCVAEVARLIGDYVFAIDSSNAPQTDLVSVIASAMQAKQLQLAVLETASQGLIAAKCLNQPWLLSVEICMDKRWQTEQADVEPQLAAQQLASRLAANKTNTLALVQLYQQQTDDFADKDQPIVLYNALYTPQGLFSRQHQIAGAKTRKQNQAALLALDLLRRYLQHQCP
jgi:hypothetical protein